MGVVGPLAGGVQPGPGPQIELAALRRSHQDLELGSLPKSDILDSQNTLQSLLSSSKVHASASALHAVDAYHLRAVEWVQDITAVSLLCLLIATLQ